MSIDAPIVEAPAEKARRPRGTLESDVKVITDQFVTGQLALDEGTALTPHRIGKAIKENDNLDSAPSTGAISNVLARWGEIGFAVINDTPKAFVDYTQAGRDNGLSALTEQSKAARKQAKAEAKAAQPEPAADVA